MRGGDDSGSCQLGSNCQQPEAPSGADLSIQPALGGEDEGTKSKTGPSGDEDSVEELLNRYGFLIQEMQVFADRSRLEHVDIHGIGGLVKLVTHLKGDVHSLTTLVERFKKDETLQASISHQLRSSNLPHYEALWALAKRSHAITDFNKSFQWQPSQNGTKSKPVHLDLTTEYGHQWVKVSTVSEKRLVYEMAKLGWNADSDSDDDLPMGDDEDDSLSVYRNASDLSKASRVLWSGDRHPRVSFVLTRLQEGKNAQIDKILNDIRKLPNLDLRIEPSLDPRDLSLEEAMPRMALDPFEGLTDTLNMDCTVLLSLASDLSHAPVNKEIWHKTATKVQIEQERKEPILPTWIYPALAGRRLVCTAKCHEHFRRIVSEIGTDAERVRAALLMGDEDVTSRGTIPAQWREMSEHDVPQTLQFPVEVIDVSEELGHLSMDDETPRLSSKRLADKISSQLTPLNSDIFMYGWRTGQTTITSNFNVTRRIIDLLNQHRKEDEQDILGPSIWSRAPSRSLIAKEKSSFRGVDCPPANRNSKMSYKPADG